MTAQARVIAAAAASVGGIDPADVAERVRRLLDGPGYRPPLLPAAAAELLRLSARVQVRFEDVAAVLEKDPVLAARVVSIAQSAALSTRSPVQTLLQAVMRLGLRGVRDAVLEAALHARIFRAPGFDRPMARLARHSTAVAHVLRAVCARTRVDVEHAFLCGLLHDVGFAAALLAVADDPALRTLPWATLEPVIDDVHEEASAHLTRAWNLPAPIRVLAARHHALDAGAGPLAPALVVAGQLAWEAGAGMAPPPEEASPTAIECPEPPLDGVDVNWTGLVEEARRLLGMEPLALCAARAEAFRLVRQVLPGEGA